ncbi:MAG: tetratricopeptide repeat protein [Candidatus Aminicenantes bacterium]|jgi:tetratricopeptide (TPR) repeat protein
MKIRSSILCLCILIGSGFCTKKTQEPDILPAVPEGAQAISLIGEPLYASKPSESTLAKLEEAKKSYDADPDTAENIIWLGRRTAYAGDYREAICIYTEGISKFRDDARFYRHRGHRYISIREFERAAQDFERAVTLIDGKEDRIEPDGMPNAMNIPVSTLHTNIWYHLGLAYYLKGDLENALRVYRKGIEASTNDDMLVATTHWLYMTLRLLGKEKDAEISLKSIHKDMNIIENEAYYRLCLFYKKELALEEIAGDEFSEIMNDAAAYGIGNWFLYNGQKDKAKQIFERILDDTTWASFGYIAAEADMIREFGE